MGLEGKGAGASRCVIERSILSLRLNCPRPFHLLLARGGGLRVSTEGQAERSGCVDFAACGCVELLGF